MRCPRCGFDLISGTHCFACGYRVPPTGKEAEDSLPDAEFKASGAAIRFVLKLFFVSALFISSIFLYIIIPSPQDAVSPALSSDVPWEVAIPVTATRQGEGQSSANPDPVTTTTQPPSTSILTTLPLDTRNHYLSWMRAHTTEGENFLVAKWERSRAILKKNDLTDDNILRAFLYVPREYFARRYNRKKAYDDTAIPIGHGQTISGPHMVSHMTQSIEPRRQDRILEIGTGSGYQSALLSELSDHVYTIEIVSALYAETDVIYRRLQKDYPEYGNIQRRNADGYFGWKEFAPFQKIIVTAGIDHIPPPLLRQLAPNGIMVIPVGPPSGQTVLRIVKKQNPDGTFTFERTDIYRGRKVIFVPFTAPKGGVHNLRNSVPEGDR
jgi:protein-L-isoaspartate(D-aspartate) O-methyltransferase